MSKTSAKTVQRPSQKQFRQPGLESEMRPRPEFDGDDYRPAGKLEGLVALVTGGDSGIGRAVAIAFAKEGADVAIVYLDEHDDARETAAEVERLERQCLTIPADLADPKACRTVVDRAVKKFSRLDVLVNNAGRQTTQ